MRAFLLYDERMLRLRNDWPPMCVVVAYSTDELPKICGGEYRSSSRELIIRKELFSSHPSEYVDTVSGVRPARFEYQRGPLKLHFYADWKDQQAVLEVREVPLFEE